MDIGDVHRNRLADREELLDLTAETVVMYCASHSAFFNAVFINILLYLEDTTETITEYNRIDVVAGIVGVVVVCASPQIV